MPLWRCDVSSHEGKRDLSENSFPSFPKGRQPSLAPSVRLAGGGALERESAF